MGVVIIWFAVICAIVLQCTEGNTTCPQETNLSEMCIPSVRSGSRVLIDMSTATEEIQDCECTFTTTANTVKLMTYSVPNYPSCGTAVNVNIGTGARAKFECLMSGTVFDTTDNKNGSISLEQSAPPFDKNYCLILEHEGRPWDSVTVTCTKVTKEVSTTPSLSPEITETSVNLITDALDSKIPLMSATESPSKKNTVLKDLFVGGNNSDIFLASPENASHPVISPTEKVTGAILFPGNVDGNKEKRYQNINMVNRTDSNDTHKTLNVESNIESLYPVAENININQNIQPVAANAIDTIVETSQAGVKIETAPLDSMSLPSARISFSAEGINTNGNAISDLSSNNNMTNAMTSFDWGLDRNTNKDLIDTAGRTDISNGLKEENTSVSESLPTAADPVLSFGSILTTLSDDKTNANSGSSGILRLTDENHSFLQGVLRSEGDTLSLSKPTEQNNTSSGLVIETATIIAVPADPLTNNETILKQNSSIDLNQNASTTTEENYSNGTTAIADVGILLNVSSSNKSNENSVSAGILPLTNEKHSVLLDVLRNDGMTLSKPKHVNNSEIDHVLEATPGITLPNISLTDNEPVLKQHFNVNSNQNLSAAELYREGADVSNHTDVLSVTTPSRHIMDTSSSRLEFRTRASYPTASSSVEIQTIHADESSPEKTEHMTPSPDSPKTELKNDKYTSLSTSSTISAQGSETASFMSTQTNSLSESDRKLNTTPIVDGLIEPKRAESKMVAVPSTYTSLRENASVAASNELITTPAQNRSQTSLLTTVEAPAEDVTVTVSTSDPLAEPSTLVLPTQPAVDFTSELSSANVTAELVSSVLESVIRTLNKSTNESSMVTASTSSESSDTISKTESPVESSQNEQLTETATIISSTDSSKMTTETPLTLSDIKVSFEIVRLLHILKAIKTSSPEKSENGANDSVIASAPEVELLLNDSITDTIPGTSEIITETTPKIPETYSLTETNNVSRTQSITAVTDKILLDSDVNGQLENINKSSDAADTSFETQTFPVNENVTTNVPVVHQTTKKAYSVVVDKVVVPEETSIKNSESNIKTNIVRKSSSQEADDPALFGINRSVLIIVLVAVGGAVLLLIIMGLVVNRRRKKRTASAPITNHKFTVDNIVYDNGALGDPEKPTISGPLELEQTNGNTPQPSSSNGIEAH